MSVTIIRMVGFAVNAQILTSLQKRDALSAERGREAKGGVRRQRRFPIIKCSELVK